MLAGVVAVLACARWLTRRRTAPRDGSRWSRPSSRSAVRRAQRVTVVLAMCGLVSDRSPTRVAIEAGFRGGCSRELLALDRSGIVVRAIMAVWSVDGLMRSATSSAS